MSINAKKKNINAAIRLASLWLNNFFNAKE